VNSRDEFIFEWESHGLEAYATEFNAQAEAPPLEQGAPEQSCWVCVGINKHEIIAPGRAGAGAVFFWGAAESE
jgi:hypothetical protein